MSEKRVRIDKWLWTTRIFKTRSIATKECKSGKVKIGSDAVKPSREIDIGEVINIRQGMITKTVKVLEIPKSRVGAKLVENYLEDLTPEEEYAKLKAARDMHFVKRDRGKGRPTKKERRQMDDLDIW